MEWVTDPTVWLGLLTLIVLEIVLGIDNLIFIAILSDKLPPAERDHARQAGLGLALVMRLGLLTGISWITTLTEPLVTVFRLEISWRDAILIAGGAFLLIKATVEIHDRLEAVPHEHARPVAHARFWPIVAQIIVLDVVFSLDSVITAVGMVDELYVMMAAVIVAVMVMLVASKPLTLFINAHPSLIILCLGFLLMVGFVLVIDGLGYHVPKGYLYAAIGFSVLIEAFNQMALRNRQKYAAATPLRQRTADAVLRLLGGVPMPAMAEAGQVPPLVTSEQARRSFDPVETAMVRSVLMLADRTVQSFMTPRTEITWIDANDPSEEVLRIVRASRHRYFLLSRGTVEEVIGIVRKEDVLELCLDDRPFDLTRIAQEPLTLQVQATLLQAFAAFRHMPAELALVVDEYGDLHGIITRTDLLRTIAGNLPEPDTEAPRAKELDDGSLVIGAAMPIDSVRQILNWKSLPEGEFNTLAGVILTLLGRVPREGETATWEGWTLRVSRMSGWRIDEVIAHPPAKAGAAHSNQISIS